LRLWADAGGFGGELSPIVAAKRRPAKRTRFNIDRAWGAAVAQR
jgi:hypothetical protein